MKVFFQALVLFLLLGIGWLFFFLKSGEESAESKQPAAGEKRQTEKTIALPEKLPGQTSPGESSSRSSATIVSDPELQRWLDFWDADPSPAEARQALADLRKWAESIPADEASRLLEAWFRQSPEKQTGLDFIVGPEGRLRQASTWKSFLLDTLRRVDAATALALAREAFQAPLPQAAAVFSLHLSHFGRLAGESDRDAILVEQWQRLAGKSAWRDHPTNGFVESADVLVFTRGGKALDDLVTWLEPAAPSKMQKAASIALDRLILEKPEVLPRLAAEAALFRIDEKRRPPLLARADPTNPAHRSVLANYLLSGQTTPGERELFFDMFPNLRITLVHGLLTQPMRLSHEEISRRLNGAEALFEEWASDPRFEDRSEDLARGLEQIRLRGGE